MKTLQMALKDGFIHLTIMKIKLVKDHFQQVKTRKVIGLFKDELGGNIMEEFWALRAEVYAYLINGYNDDDYNKEKNNR